MVHTVLAIAGTFGDRSLHATLVERLTASHDRATRALLAGALGSFRDPALVKENLALAETAPLDFRELFQLLFGAFGWPEAREVVFKEAGEHFDLFAARLPERLVTYLFFSGQGFCDAQHRAAVEAAFGPRAAKVLGGTRQLAQVLEQVDLCIADRALQLPSINAYFGASPR
jgi:alanyl aminopeptidase